MSDAGLSALQMLSRAVSQMLEDENRLEGTTLFANILWCAPWESGETEQLAVAVLSTFPLNFLFPSH